MKLNHTLGYLLLLVSSASGQNVIGTECEEMDEELNRDPQVVAAAVLMGSGYPEVPQPTDPLEIKTVLNWGAMSENRIYSRMQGECVANSKHSMCTVRTETRFSQTVAGQAATNHVIEEDKPVCFPPTCSAFDIAIIEAQPGRCDPSSNIRPCEIISYNVTCPADRQVEAGTCQQTMNTLTSPFFIQRSLLEGRVRSGCPQNVAVSQSTDLCTVEVGQLEVSSKRDYTGKEEDQNYVDFARECLTNGGKMCDVDMTTDQQSIREGIGALTLKREYNSIPICMAKQCVQEDETNIVKKRFRVNISGVPCDLTDGSCTVDVQSIDCDSISLAPTISHKPVSSETVDPTPSPTVQVISEICQSSNEVLNPLLRGVDAVLVANYPDVPEMSDPIFVETTQHWNVFKDSGNTIYSRMERDCEGNTNYTLCTVDTNVEYSQEIAGQAATNNIVEKDKPVCFPPTCADSEIAIIEDEPARCDPNTFPCTILSYDVTCPANRPIDTSSGECMQTLNTLTSPFFIGRNLLEGRISASCVAGGGQFCTIDADDVIVKSTRDYTGYETNDAYKSYNSECLANGGQMCHMDMVVTADADRAENTLGLAVRLQRTLIDHPICISVNCAAGGEIESVIRADVPACDNSCTVDISRIECDAVQEPDGNAPTRSPAVPTTPTSPTDGVRTRAPVADDTSNNKPSDGGVSDPNTPSGVDAGKNPTSDSNLVSTRGFSAFVLTISCMVMTLI